MRVFLKIGNTQLGGSGRRLKLVLSPRARYLEAAAAAASPRISPRGYSCRASTQDGAKEILLQMLQRNLHWDVEWVPAEWPHAIRICKFLFCANVLYLDYRNEYQASICIDDICFLQYIEDSRPQFMNELVI